MISHKHKCIFIHIPKTAGTSISNFYFPNTGLDWKKPNYELLYGWCPKRKIHLQHATSKQLLELKLIKPETWCSYFKFTFVRNPYERAYSDYFWVMNDRGIEGSFEDFIYKKGPFNKILNDNSIMEYRGDHLKPQTDFFDFEGIYKPDFIGRFEKLNKAVNQINEKLGIKQEFNVHVQKGQYKKVHYSKFYSKEMKSLVENLYKNDLSKLDYKFKWQSRFKSIIEKL